MDSGETKTAEPAAQPAEVSETAAPQTDIQAYLDQATQYAGEFIQTIQRPSWLLQIAIIIACFAAAHISAQYLTPRFEERLRRIESQPRLLRAFVVPLRRLRWIIFAILLWLSALSINQITWSSRSYYVGILATLVAVWVLISITSRFIRNRTLANIFAILAWTFAALSVVGWLDEALTVLDNAALSIGNFRISLLIVLKGSLLLIVLIWLSFVVSDAVERSLRKNEDLAPALQVLLGKIIKFTLLTVALLVTLSAVGIDLTALTVFSGALGLGIGFGLQKVASNLISGIIILLDRSIKPGDVISLGDTFGWINSLKSRYVSVLTRDGVEYLIPNEVFVAEQVVNWSHTNKRVRLEIAFGVSYRSDPHHVRKLAIDAVSSLDRVLSTPAPVCHLVAFGDSSINFVLRFWIRDPVGGLTNLKGAAFLALWDTFKENEIEIPYPHMQLVADDPIHVQTSPRTGKR